MFLNEFNFYDVYGIRIIMFSFIDSVARLTDDNNVIILLNNEKLIPIFFK